ncbi:Ferredoxin, 2Fe-2S [Labilithrix luteola]|uniref:Ferredoxin, 2Fe-2S n=1 Tax=Labilithrix luteola TaxID=1391654 RepID=A0A0K1QD13_9BACT|nr:Rieske 2Fe-2S domain-containing protein [Labilithrix luteola]AKV03618.1 Ferredoxin, 2Fe-2S [Labilithrix luteola]
MTTELRKRVYTTPPGVKLVPVASIPDPGARNVVLQIGEAFFHGFLVHKNGEVRGWVDRCPHHGLPLAQKLDQYLTPDASMIACSWHGALFRVEDGHCLGGPCVGGRLTPWPVEVLDGIVTTA